MTAKELALEAKATKPHVRYAYAANDATVLAWDEQLQEWFTVACRVLGSGNWIAMRFRLLVNGENFQTTEFTEV